jgi:CheY-like chemotaxis protein
MPPIDEVSQFDSEGRLQGRTLHVITPEAYKALVNPDFEITSETRDRFRAVRTSLRHSAEQTLGMKVVYDMPHSHNEADIYFFDSYIVGQASHGKSACAMHQTIVKFSPLVVLCSGAGPLNQLKNEKIKGKMVILRHPLGPKKFANTFLSALQVGKLDMATYHSDCVEENQRLIDQEEARKAPSVIEVNEAKATYHNDCAKENQRLIDQEEARRAPSIIKVNDTKAGLVVPAKDLSQNGRPRDRSRSPRPEPYPIQDHAPVIPAHINSVSSPAVLIGNTARQTQHLLLVDDNPINLKILTTLVKRLNHTFETASNGLEAVQLYKASLVQNHQFDFVFMDISMPVMNGFEATREIRRFEKDEKVSSSARIAALTGLGSSESRQEAFASGTNLFLTKPVKLAEIKKLLEHEQVRGEDLVGG